MERPVTTRRPSGVAAKLMAKPQGNQRYEEEEEEGREEGKKGEDVPGWRGGGGGGRVEEDNGEQDGDDVLRFSEEEDDDRSSASSPPLSPSKHESPSRERRRLKKEKEAEAQPEDADSEPRDSVGDETEGSIGAELAAFADDPQQLQHDIHVLAAHLQLQTQELTCERSVNQSLREQLQLASEALARQLESVLVEHDALHHENARLLAERDDSAQRAQAASESHDELLRALRAQQQREDDARTIVTALVRERDALKKQLDESKTYCRRLEEDVVAMRAEQQQLCVENKTLQSAAKASSAQRNDRETRLLQEQELVIQSLRADLLQMEFEFKTLSVDKDRLSHRVATLQRQSESRSTSYDVISLKGDADQKNGKPLTKKRLSVVTGAASSPDGGGFTNLLTLPNGVVDDNHHTLATTPRARTPVGSLVSKTLSSAKKKLFQASSPRATPVVLPQ